MSLLTSINCPKVIFLTGCVASGKTTICNELNLKNYNSINLDYYYEPLLINNIGHMDIKNYTQEELSISNKLIWQAQKSSKENYNQLKELRKNLVIDTTGSSTKNIISMKNELEELGYNSFMICILNSLENCLERNHTRKRSLKPIIVLRTWRDFTNNIPFYKNNFINFLLLTTDDINFNKSDIDKWDLKKKYFDSIKGSGKIYSLIEKQRKEEELNNLWNEIQELNNYRLNKKEFVLNSKEELFKQINEFINE